MHLPEEYRSDMERLLGEDYPQFLASYDMPRRNGLRVNRLKISPEAFEKISPFELERIPWTDNGYYVDWRDQPARHPYYSAGLYYLQEPSAMAPAQILPVSPGDRVLDLCAAPGGKATELGARLAGGVPAQEGLLVANEISAQRARALLHNLELFGIANALVTNESPARLQERFPCYFDKILVDAPCSGEGMFRKDPSVMKAWSPEKVDACSAVQREILLSAADMLRPGGYMVYSTCTFAPQEDEMILLYLLSQRDDIELVPFPLSGGRESFSPAFDAGWLREAGFIEPGSALSEVDADLSGAVRIWPHRSGGEGHFTALLRKKEEDACGERTGKAAENRPSAAGTGNRTSAVRAGNKTSAARKGRAGSLTREEERYLGAFSERFLPGCEIDQNRLEIHDQKVYLTPAASSSMRSVAFLRNGLYLGEMKKNRFEPSQAFAMALPPGDGIRGRISFSPEDDQVLVYLRGGEVKLPQMKENGWYLVCVDGFQLGWGKLSGGTLKNKLLAAWRS